MNYYIGDLHLYHKRILEIDNRKESSIEEMHENIIKDWNSRITDKDTGYILGDVSLGYKKDYDKVEEIIKRLKGHKILILGNHDDEKICKRIFEDVHKMLDIYEEINGFGKVKVVLSHFPQLVWNKQHYGAIHVYGHTHRRDFWNGVANTNELRNAYCVSAGEIGYIPMTANELVEKYGYSPCWYSNRNKNRHLEV